MPWSDETPRGRRQRHLSDAETALYQDDAQVAPVSRFDRARGLAQSALPKGAVILGILFAVNSGSAFLKQKVLGHIFGAGVELDALNNAIRLTQFPVDLLILGGVVGPFLPLFLGLKGEAETAARDFARTILTSALIVIAMAMAFVVVFASPIASFTGPGFQGSDRDMYVALIRVVALGQIAITASLVLGEVLVAERRFLAYGLADFALYGGVAVGALLLGGVFGIYGAAIGFLLGALGHLGVRLVGIYRTTFRPRPSLSLRTKGVGEFAWLMLPKMVGAGLVSLLVVYFNQISSTLAPGSTTSVTIATEFQSAGESVVGLAFALAAFPALSAAAAAGDMRAFRRVFRTNLITIAFFSTCAAVAIIVFGSFAVSLLKGGAFDETDASRTTLVLVILAVSIPFESLVELFARAIYATHNTFEPMVAVAAGFVAGVVITTTLSASLGLAALPLGYVAFRVVHLAVLAIFLRPRMARVGGASSWSRAIVRDRWDGVRGANRGASATGASPAGASPAGASPAGPMPTGRYVLAAVLAVALTAGTVLAGAQVLSHSTFVGEPQTTPWVRANGTRELVLTLPPATPSVAPSTSSSAPIQSPIPAAKPSAAPSGSSGIFVMDLYREGDFVSEFKDTWCVAAAMQTSMNMMSATADRSRDTQAMLFDLAVSIAGSQKGGTDPDGWAAGLTSLGYGGYSVGANVNMTTAIHTVAKQIRITERPAGLVVWRGWHSWVVSGFTATADPALTDKFTVLTVRIEDVWYPRVSTLWPKSRPPDADVPISALAPDYKPWLQSGTWPGRDGRYVYVIPEL